MSNSKAKKTTATAVHPASDANDGPYAGLMAELKEHLDVIRNSEEDDGKVKHAMQSFNHVIKWMNAGIKLDNHCIRLGISSKLPF